MKTKKLIAILLVIAMMASMGAIATAVDVQNLNTDNNSVATQEEYESICLYVEQNFPPDYRLSNEDIAEMLESLGLTHLEVRQAIEPDIVGIKPSFDGAQASAGFANPGVFNDFARAELWLFNERTDGLPMTITFTGNVEGYALATGYIEVVMFRDYVNTTISWVAALFRLGVKHTTYQSMFAAGNYVRFEAQLFANGIYMGYTSLRVNK